MIRSFGLGALNHAPGDAIDPQNIIASEPIPSTLCSGPLRPRTRPAAAAAFGGIASTPASTSRGSSRPGAAIDRRASGVDRGTELYRISAEIPDQSALMPANLTTFAHFSVS